MSEGEGREASAGDFLGPAGEDLVGAAVDLLAAFIRRDPVASAHAWAAWDRDPAGVTRALLVLAERAVWEATMRKTLACGGDLRAVSRPDAIEHLQRQALVVQLSILREPAP